MNFQVDMPEGQKFKFPIEQRIKELSADKNLTISDLSKKAKLDEGTIYNVFKTGRGRLVTLKKIADALEVGLDELQVNSSVLLGDKSIEKGSIPGKLIPTKKIQLYLSQLPEKDAELYIPYYDVEITAGKIELYFDDVDEMPEGYIYAPQYRDCIACNVKGDSMYDRIYPGSRLYVYHLPNRKYIDYGQIYLVVLDGYRLLKYIHPHPSDDTKIRLSSYNKHYHHWDVEKADILNLFLVKGYENQNAM